MVVNKPVVRAVLIFSLIGVGLFANALNNPFHFDDRHSIEYNRHLRSLANIPQFFTDPGTFSSERRGTMFRPLLLSSYAFNYALHGDSMKTARLLGHRGDDDVLFSHYRALYDTKTAANFFSIRPSI